MFVTGVLLCSPHTCVIVHAICTRCTTAVSRWSLTHTSYISFYRLLASFSSSKLVWVALKHENLRWHFSYFRSYICWGTFCLISSTFLTCLPGSSSLVGWNHQSSEDILSCSCLKTSQQWWGQQLCMRRLTQTVSLPFALHAIRHTRLSLRAWSWKERICFFPVASVRNPSHLLFLSFWNAFFLNPFWSFCFSF